MDVDTREDHNAEQIVKEESHTGEVCMEVDTGKVSNNNLCPEESVVGSSTPAEPELGIIPAKPNLRVPFYLLSAKQKPKKSLKKLAKEQKKVLKKMGASKKCKKSLSRFVGFNMDELVADVECGLRSNEKADYFCSLKRMVEQPLACRKEILPLDHIQLSGFRLQCTATPKPLIPEKPKLVESESEEMEDCPLKISLKKSKKGDNWGIRDSYEEANREISPPKYSPEAPKKKRERKRSGRPTPTEEPAPKRMVFYNTEENCVSGAAAAAEKERKNTQNSRKIPKLSIKAIPKKVYPNTERIVRFQVILLISNQHQ